MLGNIIRGVIATVVFFPYAALGQVGVGEKCMRDVLETHIRDQKALKAPPPQGPVRESLCRRSESKDVGCFYYDNRDTPDITLELRLTFARVITCFEQAGKQTRKTGNVTYFDLPIESCSIGLAEKDFDAWSFLATCGPKLRF